MPGSQEKNKLEIKCFSCGYINTEEQIDHYNSTNEEGEDYNEYDFECKECHTTLFEGSGWGDYDEKEAIEEIKDRFSEETKVIPEKPKHISLSPGHGKI